MHWIGWVANALIVISAWRIAYKERWALLIGVTGGLLWSVKAAATGQWDLLSIELILCALQLFAWNKWGKSS